MEETQKEQKAEQEELEPKSNSQGESEENQETPKANETNDQLEKLELEKQEVFNRMQRLQADYENLKKRGVKERVDLLTSANADLVKTLLPVIDNFQRALDSEKENTKFKEGIELILKQFMDILEKEGLKEIESVNKEFDPNYHDAVMNMQDPDLPENTIVEVLQKGFTFKDKVIRPAMVKVNS
ncbi:nucleotide exchange factor GrpE [Alkalicella caledoniensis]|uniref:Protein GrpE n=1 Tax=Alkalicella caledoniensis TaxID=2731377 RepID=A0A7G9W4F9_ALKCA|nr:nucleotide exchange factor GrpE [Alkalicella caledoniensis]QNO13571.1 nucleotide exchange factor GrpE [Alkalicella caledoniensis]